MTSLFNSLDLRAPSSAKFYSNMLLSWVLILTSTPAFSALNCRGAVKTSFAQEWQQIEKSLIKSKDLKDLSVKKVGHFSFVLENINRQIDFLDETLLLAKQLNVDSGQLSKILEKAKSLLNSKSASYQEVWLLHFAMQVTADFNFDLKTIKSTTQLDHKSIDYVLKKMNDSNFNLSQISSDSDRSTNVQRSMGLMYHYTDFNNPRFKAEKRAKALNNERIPLPFFQKGFSIIEINNMARTSRMRPVEILSGYYEANSAGEIVFKAPMVDNRLMGVGKDASDHDFNHLGFEISAGTTRELGRILFDGSEKLSANAQTVIQAIYFKAWHEWGINLSVMEPGTQWAMLLNPNFIKSDLTNPYYFGGDPLFVKGVDGVDEAVQFLKKKSLPEFWK